jgi:hypothetical protein
VTLRESEVVEAVRLPDGREAIVRVGVLPDPYVRKEEIDTVSLEVTLDGEHAAFVNTVLEPEQADEAAALARDVAAGLESGKLEPSASALEPLADRLR